MRVERTLFEQMRRVMASGDLLDREPQLRAAIEPFATTNQIVREVVSGVSSFEEYANIVVAANAKDYFLGLSHQKIPLSEAELDDLKAVLPALDHRNETFPVAVIGLTRPTRMNPKVMIYVMIGMLVLSYFFAILSIFIPPNPAIYAGGVAPPPAPLWDTLLIMPLTMTIVLALTIVALAFIFGMFERKRYAADLRRRAMELDGWFLMLGYRSK
jgi:uncharacterized membrane protein